MRKVLMVGLLLIFLSASNLTGTIFPEKVGYRCLIQLTNYGGEGAYVITSLLDAEDQYVKTLYVGGDDEEWYPDLPTWFKYYENSGEEIDGITGASIQSGGRKVALLEVEANQLDSGYKLRFESSVEDGLYHDQDIELDLSSEMVGKTISGSGYIRYVRIIAK
ncbi:MAG: DUF2271 domain-containing protein [Bacteroidota bacterium]